MGIEDSLYFEDVKEGQQVPSFTRAPNLMEWNRYAAVNDEFVYIHMDVDKAQAAGMKDVFGMGNLRLAYLHNMLRDWIGVTGDIRRIDVQHRSLNFKDEQAHLQGHGDQEVRRGRREPCRPGSRSREPRGPERHAGHRHRGPAFPRLGPRQACLPLETFA